MAKMVFDGYEDAPLAPETPRHRNVIAPNRSDKGSAVADTIAAAGKAGAGLIEPMLAVVDHALTLIPDIFRSIAVIAVECERTKQIQAQVHGQIELAKQETKRISIQETENTKRVLEECKRDVQLKELELRQFREELSFKEKKAKMSHDEYIRGLDMIEKNTKPLVDASAMLTNLIPTVFHDDVTLQSCLTSMNAVHHDLVELAKQVVTLRNGGSIDV